MAFSYCDVPYILGAKYEVIDGVFLSVLSCWFWTASNPEIDGQFEDAYFSCVKDDFHDLLTKCL